MYCIEKVLKVLTGAANVSCPGKQLDWVSAEPGLGQFTGTDLSSQRPVSLVRTLQQQETES